MSRLEKALENALKRRLSEGSDRPSSPASVKPLRHKSAAVKPTVSEVPSKSASPPPHHFPSDKGAAVETDRLSPYVKAVLEADSPYADAYRKIRTNILARAPEGMGGAFLVTSSMPAEGKTLTALNLALVLAQQVDQTVLLVDADLRRSSVHRYLGLKPRQGLSDYLKERSVRLADVLLHTGLGRLVILPAGTPVENPSEILSSRRMQALIDELRNRYPDRLILFDSAPILAAAETVTLASWVDGVVFVVREGVTPLKTVRNGYELIHDCRVIGTVINGATPFGAVAGYGGYGVYGYYGVTSGERRKS